MAADKVLAAPVITVGGTVAISAADGAAVWYTVDGSDPRYSATAAAYTAAFAAPEAGSVIRAAAKQEGMFTSPVAEKTV